uniref:MADS transcription factor AP3-1 n=1 Tax=Berberis sp. CZ-2020 TaxID=2774090 RepID=A0A7L7T4B0_9MAGN|nr:MADS transcription factor AP3-1 [Berberis sp. CZ-2020]
MGRGKIEIKKIENSTNRQVTYSKRRAGIMKKAKELTVLCDAQVSLIMFSNTSKLSEFNSPSITMKETYDRYQQITGLPLWQSHYEAMQENLNKLKERNNKLRREIRQRSGEDDLDNLTIEDLHSLEQNLDTSLKTVRDRKYHSISTQTDTYKKKMKSVLRTHNDLLHEIARVEDLYARGQHDEDYQATLELANGASHMLTFRLQPSQPNLHNGGYGPDELRLAFE